MKGQQPCLWCIRRGSQKGRRKSWCKTPKPIIWKTLPFWNQTWKLYPALEKMSKAVTYFQKQMPSKLCYNFGGLSLNSLINSQLSPVSHLKAQWKYPLECIELQVKECLNKKELNHKIKPRVYGSIVLYQCDFPSGSVGRESACNAGDAGDTDSWSLGQEDSLEKGHGNSLTDCLENPMDRAVWRGYSP